MSGLDDYLYQNDVAPGTGKAIVYPTLAPLNGDSIPILLGKIAAGAGGSGGGGTGGTFNGQVSGQVGITGGVINIGSGEVTAQTLGVAVTPDEVSYSHTTGQKVSISIDQNNGAILVNDRRKERPFDSISADPYQYQNSPSNSSIASGSGIIMTLGTGEKGFIQNLGSGAIAVKRGSGASPTSLSLVLNPYTAVGMAGGQVTINDFSGPVSVASYNNTELRYIAWKVSP